MELENLLKFKRELENFVSTKMGTLIICKHSEHITRETGNQKFIIIQNSELKNLQAFKQGT